MTTTRTRAFTLMEILVSILLIAAVTTLGTYGVTRSLRIQNRASAWANDDTVTKGILHRLRGDLANAKDAEMVTDGSGALLLRGPGGEVRYRNLGNGVERIEQPKGAEPTRYAWPLTRSSLRWSVEGIVDGGKVVWTRVEILDPIRRGGRPTMDAYATAGRVGLAAGPKAEGRSSRPPASVPASQTGGNPGTQASPREGSQ